MDEDFERHRGDGAEVGEFGGTDFLNFLEGTFACEHDEIRAQIAGELDAGSAGHGHLRRCVNREIGRETADKPADADVLYDRCVHAGGNDRAQIIFGIRQLRREDQRVECHVSAYPAAMEKLHELR